MFCERFTMLFSWKQFTLRKKRIRKSFFTFFLWEKLKAQQIYLEILCYSFNMPLSRFSKNVIVRKMFFFFFRFLQEFGCWKWWLKYKINCIKKDIKSRIEMILVFFYLLLDFKCTKNILNTAKGSPLKMIFQKRLSD